MLISFIHNCILVAMLFSNHERIRKIAALFSLQTSSVPDVLY